MTFSKLDSLVHAHVNRETGLMHSLAYMEFGENFSYAFSRTGNRESEIKYERPVHAISHFYIAPWIRHHRILLSGDSLMTLAFYMALAMNNPQNSTGEAMVFLPKLCHLKLCTDTSEEILKQLAARQRINAIQQVCWLPCEHG